MASTRASVLFFTASLGGGGAESQALRVMNHLDRERFVPSLAVTRRGGSYEQFLRPDVTVTAVSIDKLPSSLGRLIIAPAFLRRHIERCRPDIVCSVMDRPNLAALMATTRLAGGPATVLCVQIPPSVDLAGGSLQNRAVLSGIKRFYRYADSICALSHGVKGDLVALAPELEPKITVIHNACVDENVLAGATKPLPPGVERGDAPVLLACGRLVEQKGYPFLLEAFAEVLASHPAELWVLGDGPLRGALERRCTELGIARNVRWLGFHDNPYSFMAACDVFVLSSLWEGFGNVIVEAMACGAPVVATDCPYGPSEIITDGVDGLLVPPRDSRTLAAAILRTLTQPELRQALVTSGKRRSEAFSAERVADAYADLFDSVRSGHAPR